MKFELFFLVLTVILIAAQVVEDELYEDDYTMDMSYRGWWDDMWDQIKGTFTLCPPCDSDGKPDQWSPPYCKCYFKTRVTVKDRDCCIFFSQKKTLVWKFITILHLKIQTYILHVRTYSQFTSILNKFSFLWLLNGVERPREPHTPYRKLPVHDSRRILCRRK
ncbi:hypothetical protein ACKWTF_001527 [Chironomus riparius]